MKSAAPGEITSNPEVTGPCLEWLPAADSVARELFLSFEDFPWFRDALPLAVGHVECHSDQHLYWPELDIDLSIDSIRDPRRFPLISRRDPR